jgi:hypothetical protein
VPTKSRRSTASDADAEAYLLAVEAADLQPIEDAVAVAINNFVVGCKSDGIWSALKSSCLLAGARTLSGALVPLAGTAPTNANFVAGDYDRKTGLKGDGTNKYIATNRLNNADPQNSKHIAVYRTQTITPASVAPVFLGRSQSGGNSNLQIDSVNRVRFAANSSSLGPRLNTLNQAGLLAISRSSSSLVVCRFDGGSSTQGDASTTPLASPLKVFSDDRNFGGSYASDRISFYSIGENLNLAALETRLLNLMTALATALP